MYCIQCGVKLSDTEKQCPLCGTIPFHPEIKQANAEPLYPKNKYPLTQISPFGTMIAICVLFVLPILIVLLCDLQFHRAITWSGYVVGALITVYVNLILPFWFKKPNPVIFIPTGIATIGVYLLYINLYTGGDWFLSFAFPVVGFLGLLLTAVVTLLRYLPKGALYVFGGAFIALGAFMPLMEFLMKITFSIPFFGWCFYPLAALVLLGGLLLFLAICPPAKETMERKFFL